MVVISTYEELPASWPWQNISSVRHFQRLRIHVTNKNPSRLTRVSFIIGFNLWSKDIIFLIADEYLEGTHAWLKAYHGLSQPSMSQLSFDRRFSSLSYPFDLFPSEINLLTRPQVIIITHDHHHQLF
jgi:hypothetical protein